MKRRLVIVVEATVCSSKGCKYHDLHSGQGYCDDEWWCSYVGRYFKTEDYVKNPGVWPPIHKEFPDWCPMEEVTDDETDDETSD